MKNQRWNISIIVALLATALVCGNARSGFGLLLYPYMFPDSYDWAVNGFRYSGLSEPFEISHRAMLLPLILAGLYRLGLENLIVYYGLTFLIFGTLGIYLLLGRITKIEYAGTTALLFLTSTTILSQSSYVGADVSATMLISNAMISFFVFLQERKYSFLLLSACLLGVGIHSQYLEVILIPLLLVFMFLKQSDARLTISIGQFINIIKDRKFWFALTLALVCAIVLLVPRLLAFQLIYVERVSHLSLVHFLYQGGITYYAIAFFATFGWPTLFISKLGLFFAFSDPNLKKLSAFMLAWILSVLAFFALFYSWMDSRFLIYLAIPLYFFAAVGLVETLKRAKSLLLPRFVVFTLQAIFILTVAFFNSSSASTDPFDISIALSPWHTVEGNLNNNFQLYRKNSSPYLVEHTREASNRRNELANNDVDSANLSEPTLRVCNQLHNEFAEELRKLPVIFLDKVESYQWYYLKNRNLLYLRQPEETPTDPSTVVEQVKKQGAILIGRKSALNAFLAQSATPSSAQQTLVEDGDFVAVKAEPVVP